MSSQLNTYPLRPLPSYSPSASPAPVVPPLPNQHSQQFSYGDPGSFSGNYPVIVRSGSPTPSEAEELKQLDGIVKRAFRKESWKDRQFVISFAVLVVILAIVIVIAVFQTQIVEALTPAGEWVKKQPAGFLIPIALLIVLSVPPLFGAEIVHLLCGLIYGLGIGFLIVCVGTVIGESLTYFGFRYCFRARAEKLEKGNNGSLRFPALGRVIREGGFLVAVVVRYSALPTHVTTALFSVCGVNYWIFLSSLVLSLPRQIVGVYIGVLALEKSQGTESKLDKKISMIVLGITIAITVIAVRWLGKRQRAAALSIIRERREIINKGVYSGLQSTGSV